MTRNSAAIAYSMPLTCARIVSGESAQPSRQTAAAPTVTPTTQYEWFSTERIVQ